MNLLILDGFNSEDKEFSSKIYTAISATIRKNINFEQILLREKNIKPCLGCFSCWFKTPGRCPFEDDSQAIVKKLTTADVIMYFTPVVFGGYSSTIKKLLDKSICNISPLFTKINGEMHHKKRYDKYPVLLGLGVTNSPNKEQEDNFKNLIYRNSINMHSPAQFSEVISKNFSDELINKHLSALFNGIEVIFNDGK